MTPEEQTVACHGQALVVDLGQIHFGASAGKEHWKIRVVARCEGTEETYVEEPAEGNSATFVGEYSVDYFGRTLEEWWKTFVQTDLRFSE